MLLLNIWLRFFGREWILLYAEGNKFTRFVSRELFRLLLLLVAEVRERCIVAHPVPPRLIVVSTLCWLWWFLLPDFSLWVSSFVSTIPSPWTCRVNGQWQGYMVCTIGYNCISGLCFSSFFIVKTGKERWWKVNKARIIYLVIDELEPNYLLKFVLHLN